MGRRPVRTTLSKKNLMYRGVPKEFIHSDINEYPIDEEKKDLFVKYMDNLPQMLEDQVNIVLYGSNGSGKTYLTSLLVKECYRQRYSAYRTTLENYIQLIFNSNRPDYAERLKKIAECEFLVIDEVGKETVSKTDFNIVKLEELMRSRDTGGLVTILCMNLPLDSKNGFYQTYGKSITSLVEGTYVKLEFVGDDNRHEVSSRKKGIQILFGEDE